MRALPEGWVEVEVGEVWRKRRRSSVSPAKEPDRHFELYSVPSFETGAPERLQGSEIGSSKQEVAPVQFFYVGSIRESIAFGWSVRTGTIRRLRLLSGSRSRASLGWRPASPCMRFGRPVCDTT